MKSSFINGKALLWVLTIVSILAGKNNVKAADHEPFFRKDVHYAGINQLANDVEKGQVKFSPKVNELLFINHQIQHFNQGLKKANVLDTGGRVIQLPTFSDAKIARAYFANLLRNNCRENGESWTAGQKDIGMVDKKTGQFSKSRTRGNYFGEKLVELDPNTLPGVRTADGDYPNIAGFSLWCGNDYDDVVVTPPASKPAVVATPPPAPGHSVTNPSPSNSGYQGQTVSVGQSQVWVYPDVIYPGFGYGFPGGGTTTGNITINNNAPDIATAAKWYAIGQIASTAINTGGNIFSSVILTRNSQSYPQYGYGSSGGAFYNQSFGQQTWNYSQPATSTPGSIEGNTGFGSTPTLSPVLIQGSSGW